MRPLPNEKIEKYRIQPDGWESPRGVNWGAFLFPMGGVKLRVISSGTDTMNGWEHVSVSLEDRCPTWTEMCHIKAKFWRDDETVIQFHPTKTDYVSYHPYCLHLWKPLRQEVILPPSQLVGPVMKP